jgi:hypothetical protein
MFRQTKLKNKPKLPVDIIIYATTSQILAMKSDDKCAIKEYELPYQFTAIKYFEKAKKKTLPNMVVPLKIFICCF